MPPPLNWGNMQYVDLKQEVGLYIPTFTLLLVIDSPHFVHPTFFLSCKGSNKKAWVFIKPRLFVDPLLTLLMMCLFCQQLGGISHPGLACQQLPFGGGGGTSLRRGLRGWGPLCGFRAALPLLGSRGAHLRSRSQSSAPIYC